ncbi:phosphatase PAP2 family protein [Dechloromonas denitrificans]|nr:phosphatase PAP2 family protein [Dechloromonas denitrificans]
MSRAATAAGPAEAPMPWHRQMAAVLFRHFYLKGIGTTIFISLFFNVYFYLLKNPASPPTLMPVTWLDGLIGVQPLAVPIYVSMWVYVSLPPALLATQRELWLYGAAIGTTCLVGLLAFYFWPTAVPPANVDWSQFPELNFLKSIDASGNACPSLHVATAVFSGVWLHRLLRRFGGPLWILAGNWAWCIGIVYSTLATRQHVALDVAGGLALGLLAAWLSLPHRVLGEKP